MLINYLKITLRSFRKHYFYATLNILGLAVGFAAFILIGIYVHYETSYENFHEKADRIYRTTYRYQSDGAYGVHWARVPIDYINELPNDMPEVDKLVRFQNYERKYLRVAQEKFAPKHAYTTDAEVFDVFNFPLIAGDPATALARPYSVVLTASTARRYFGNEDAVGKTLFVTTDFSEKETRYTVTGIMSDIPAHTHLPVDLLFSFCNSEERSGWAYVYALLSEGASVSSLEEKLPDFVDKYTDNEGASRLSLVLQSLSDIHLQSDLAREITPNGNAWYVKILFFVGGFILLIALINYINLSSALALGRSQEMGVRRALGAQRSQLMAYAWVASIVYNLIAVVLGGLLAYWLFPYLQQLTGISFLLPAGWFSLAMGVVAILCGLLSGWYPALLLSVGQALAVMRRPTSLALARSHHGFTVKQAMVALQFGVSILLITSALIAYDQFRFLTTNNLGLQTEQILAIPNVPNAVTERYQVFRDRVAASVGVQQVATCMQVPSEEIRDAGPVLVAGVNDDPDQAPIMDMQIVDNAFVDMMGLRVLAGEATLPDSYPSFVEEEDYTALDHIMHRKRAYLINESAMRQLGWTTPQEAIGQRISWSIGDLRLAEGPITGVVQDYHQETLKNKVDPTIMTYEPIWLRTFLVKVETQNLPQTISNVKAAWDALYPAYPMGYHFLDELFDKLYRHERVQLYLLSIFSGLAVFIAFLGLFSLVAYSLKTRVREIAIRRVLGANLPALVRLIGREYVFIMLLGGLVAIPLSYIIATRWLQTFAYHVTISALWYILTLGLLGTLLLVVISVQTQISTAASPANILKE